MVVKHIRHIKHLWHHSWVFRVGFILVVVLLVLFLFPKILLFTSNYGKEANLTINETVVGHQTIYEQISLIDKGNASTKLEVTFTKYLWGPKIYNSPENKFVSTKPPYSAYWKDACYYIFVLNASELGKQRLEPDPYVLFNLTLNNAEYSGACDRYEVYMKNSGNVSIHNVSITYKYGDALEKLHKEIHLEPEIKPDDTIAFSFDSCGAVYDALAYDVEDGYIDNFAFVDFVFFPCQITTVLEGNRTYEGPKPTQENPENLTILTKK
jgi:hypothetical protein